MPTLEPDKAAEKKRERNSVTALAKKLHEDKGFYTMYGMLDSMPLWHMPQAQQPVSTTEKAPDKNNTGANTRNQGPKT